MIQPKRVALGALVLTLVVIFAIALNDRTSPGIAGALSPNLQTDASDSPIIATEVDVAHLETGARTRLPQQALVVPDLSQAEAALPGGEDVDKAERPAFMDFMDTSGAPDIWEVKYADVSWRQMRIEADLITDYIEPLTREVLEQLWQNDDYIVLPLTRRANIKEGEWWDDGDFLPGLELQVGMSDGEKRRYRVPEAQYPELYKLARKGQWLRNRSLSKEKNSRPHLRLR